MSEEPPPAAGLDVVFGAERRDEDPEDRDQPDNRECPDENLAPPAAEGRADRAANGLLVDLLRGERGLARLGERGFWYGGGRHAPIISSARFCAWRFMITIGITSTKISTASAAPSPLRPCTNLVW